MFLSKLIYQVSFTVFLLRPLYYTCSCNLASNIVLICYTHPHTHNYSPITSMLSCPTCHCAYTTSGENQPRLLSFCGHTFCYKCLEERRKVMESPETLQCPQCSLPCSENHVPNITIMKYVEVMNEKSDERVSAHIYTHIHTVHTHTLYMKKTCEWHAHISQRKMKNTTKPHKNGIGMA